MRPAASYADGAIHAFGDATNYLVPMSASSNRYDLAAAPSFGHRASEGARARTEQGDEVAVDDSAGEGLRAVNLALALREARTRGTASPDIGEAQARLERRIRAHLEQGAVQVTLTDNRYTMISVRRLRAAAGREPRFELRLHHMFTEADPVIMRSLARYVADNDRDASRVLGDFIDGNQRAVRGQARRAPRELMITAGEVYDLREIFDDLNRRYFDGRIDASITWGPRLGPPRRRNSIKMGSYAVEDRLIRIHRTLDRVGVPRFFVEWIVFHEMLHQVHDIKVKNGRREYHSKAFLADEARFEQYAEARMWERRNLDALLSS